MVIRIFIFKVIKDCLHPDKCESPHPLTAPSRPFPFYGLRHTKRKLMSNLAASDSNDPPASNKSWREIVSITETCKHECRLECLAVMSYSLRS